MENKESCVPCSHIRIPVTWGHIAGLWYGSQTERPILAIHGWEDNCGSFAKLAPLIAPHRSVLCLDLPGHGRSSHLPPGVIYDNFDFVRLIQRIMQVYGWERVSLMGHSMGASVCFVFASFFPDRVDLVIALDILVYRYVPPDEKVSIFRVVTEKALDYNEQPGGFQKNAPTYTFGECEDLLHRGSLGSIDTDNCKYILTRSTSQSPMHPNKYYFSRDRRTRLMFSFTPPVDMSIEMAKRFCSKALPYLVVKGGQSLFRTDDCGTLESFLQASNRNFETHLLPAGTHHLHLNNPRPVAELIIAFLLKHKKSKM